jgi:hypothetical protein
MTIEKAIAASLEPVVDSIIALENKLASVQLIPGPKGDPGEAGQSVTVDEVVKVLVSNHAAVLKGADGLPGAKGEDGAPGLPGKSVDPNHVALLLKQDSDFLAATKGAQGNQGAPGYPGNDGAAGKDAAPDEVAGFLKQDACFLSVVKGEPGDRGEPGEPGPAGADGKSVDAAYVAELIKSDAPFVQSLHGKDGQPGIGIKSVVQDADLSAIEFVLDNDQVVKVELPVGPPGKDGDAGAAGKDGRNGLGIDAKRWTPGIYREGAIVTHGIGMYFKANCDTTNSPDVAGDWERMGTSGFRWKGVKDESVQYDEGDLYIDKGTTFLWSGGKSHMFAQRGKDGKNGVDGAKGASPVSVDLFGTSVCFAFDNGDTYDIDVGPMLKDLVAAQLQEYLGNAMPAAKTDSDAATKGVALHGLYRSGNSVKIRTS